MGSSTAPVATTPSIARKRRYLMIPVIEMALTEPEDIFGRFSIPVIPASIMRWAPAKVIYPPTVPPTSVRIVIQSIFDGRTVSLRAIATGGWVLKTMKRTIAIIITPSTFVKLSIALPISLLRKRAMAMTALAMAPGTRGTPIITLSPIAAPPTLPMLKTSPPSATRKARK